MKKNVLLIVLLILCAISIFVFCKGKFAKKDFVQQQLPTNQEEQVQDNNTEEVNAESDKIEQKNEESQEVQKTTTKKNIKIQKKQENQVKTVKVKDIAENKKDAEEEALLKETHRSTRSDIVDVKSEYISPKNSGQIYYRGEFYNVKIRQVLGITSQDETKPEVVTTVLETKTVVESKPVEPVVKPVKFEKTSDAVLQTDKQNETIKNPDEVILKP